MRWAASVRAPARMAPSSFVAAASMHLVAKMKRSIKFGFMSVTSARSGIGGDVSSVVHLLLRTSCM